MDPVAVVEASRKHASGLAFTPDGAHLVTGGMEGRLKVWRTADWTLAREVEGHTASVNAIEFLPGRAVTAGSDKSVRVWALPEWTEAARLDGYVDVAAGEGALFLRKDRGDRVYRHDIAAGNVAATVATSLQRLTGFWALPGAIAVGGTHPVLQVRDPVDLSLVHALDGHGTAVTAVTHTADGRTVCVADYEGRVHLWDIESVTRTATRQLGKEGYFFAAIAPDGRHVATAGDGVIAWHEVDGATEWAHEPGIKGVYDVSMSADGRWLANAAADGRVRVFEMKG